MIDYTKNYYICSAERLFLGLKIIQMSNILKIDRTKLRTVSNYAKENAVTRQAVHNWIKDKKIKTIEIDGVTFVSL